MYKLFLFIFLIFVSNPVFANVYDHSCSASFVVSQLPHITSVKTTFIQEKSIKGLQNSVKSSGEFEFIEGKGVVFSTKYPQKYVTTYTSANNKYINDVITAISNKNFSRLEKNFDIFYQKTGENWILALKPKKNSKASAQINFIEIFGSSQISKLIISQQNMKIVLTFGV